MQVTVTFNVETDLDIVNSPRSDDTKIVLDERKATFSPTPAIVEPTYPPCVRTVRKWFSLMVLDWGRIYFCTEALYYHSWNSPEGDSYLSHQHTRSQALCHRRINN